MQIGQNGERGICAIKDVAKDIYTNTAIATVRRKTGLLITREVDLLVAHGKLLPLYKHTSKMEKHMSDQNFEKSNNTIISYYYKYHIL